MRVASLRQRVLLVLTCIALILVSTAIGIALADWPFLQRALQVAGKSQAEWPDQVFQPAALIGTAAARRPASAPADFAEPVQQALQDTVRWAESRQSGALLVAQQGQLLIERYWRGMDGAQLSSTGDLARALLGVMTGYAVANERVSLDDAVLKHLPEWAGDPRGSITLRQLLQDTSGLETDSAARMPWGRDARLLLGNDFAATALSYGVAHEAGFHFAPSRANAQLAGVVLERALGDGYERLVESLLWRPLEAGPAQFYLDRRNGMPATYCCLKATPLGLLRLGMLLASDGLIDGVQVLPRGWVGEMMRGSRANPLHGLQVALDEAGTLILGDGGPHTIWAVPSLQLAIVRLGAQPGVGSELPPSLLRSLRPAP
jgi:CubicO group peptidase (beta-lactamase class C family)